MLIGKNWRVESDSLNVTILKRSVARKGKHIGEETWTPEGFYSNPQSALKALVDYGVSETGLTDLKAVIKKQEELYKLIKEAIK